MEKREVLASVKDERLVEKRRTQMIKGAVTLFKEKGFHRTTTREIAKAAGFSIGTLYEYIRTKEDILYLVCDFIYDEVQEKLQKEIEQSDGTLESLKLTIAYFYKVMDDIMCDIGTANFDKRSCFLNSEMNCIVFDRTFIKDVEKELAVDLAESKPLNGDALSSMNVVRSAKESLASILSPFL